MKLKKLICLVAYYGFAMRLPASTSPMTHWTRTIRRAICRPLFDYCGENVLMSNVVWIGVRSIITDKHDNSNGVVIETGAVVSKNMAYFE